jgi:hypothetical protein
VTGGFQDTYRLTQQRFRRADSAALTFDHRARAQAFRLQRRIGIADLREQVRCFVEPLNDAFADVSNGVCLSPCTLCCCHEISVVMLASDVIRMHVQHIRSICPIVVAKVLTQFHEHASGKQRGMINVLPVDQLDSELTPPLHSSPQAVGLSEYQA